MTSGLEGALQGKSFAVVGLAVEELLSLAAALDRAGASWQAFGKPPDESRLGVFSGAICSAAIAPELSAYPGPLLIIGPVDSITMYSDDESREYVIAPPLHVEEVVLRLYRVVSARPAAHVAATTGHDVPTILAADDDVTTTAIVRTVITRNAMTCHTASDGRQALEMAKQILPNAIVLDVNMPHMDGFEVLAALRAEPRTAGIPVVMLTSVQQEADVVRGFGLGADDYVVKPFNPMELLARLKRLVRKRT